MDGRDAQWFSRLLGRTQLLSTHGIRAEVSPDAGPDDPSDWALELEVQNSDLRRTLIELSEEKEQGQRCFDLAPLPVVSIDGRSAIVASNRLAQELFQTRRLCGKYVSSFLCPEQADALHRHLATHPPDGVGVRLCTSLELGLAGGGQRSVVLYTSSVDAERTVFQGIFVPSESSLPPLLAQRSSSAQRLLLVDDEPQVRDALERQLADLGFRVDCARSAMEALSMLFCTTAPYHCLVTDIDMPVMPGTRLGAFVADYWSDLPLLYVTGGDHRPEDLGAPVLRKPFTFDELEAALGQILAAPRASPRSTETD